MDSSAYPMQKNDGEKVTEFQAHRQCVSSCQLCYHDTIIVSASHDATIALWACFEEQWYIVITHKPMRNVITALPTDLTSQNASNGKKLNNLPGHSDRVVSCKADEHQNRLLSASWDKSLVFWDINRSQNRMIWSGRQDSLLTSCDFSSSHQLAVAAADSGYSHFWDTRSGLKVTKIKGHTNTVTCCKFDYSGINLCTCSMDCTALVWDIRMWKYLLKLSGHINVVSSCAFSRNNHWLATTSWDKTLRLYDIAVGTYRSKGPVVFNQHNGCVSSCDFARDDTLLVSVGYDLDVNIWCMNSHQLKNTYKGHQGWIKDVHFGESKKWIVTCAKDGVVRVWNTWAGNEVYRKRQPMTVGIDIVKCQKCGNMFSPATSNATTQLGLCVLCRLKPQLTDK